MSNGFQDMMKADMGIFFDSSNGFAVNVVYTPIVLGSGSSPRTIAMIIDDEIDAEFETATADLDYDVATWRGRSDNDAAGVMTVTEQGRGGSGGDSFAVNGVTWYVKKKKTRPNDGATYENVLICSTSQAPLPDYFG